jgi:hypothetical protein
MPLDQWFVMLVKQLDPAKLCLFSPPMYFTLLAVPLHHNMLSICPIIANFET